MVKVQGHLVKLEEGVGIIADRVPSGFSVLCL